MSCERCCPNGREASNPERSARWRNRRDRAGQIVDRSGRRLSFAPESEFVSRHHCVLLLDDYTLRIRDLGSKNGTFVNGRRVGTNETILLHDDMISIGEMIGQIDLSQPASPSPPSPSASRGEEMVGQALHGTGFFEGDTVQAESPIGELPTTDLTRLRSCRIPLPSRRATIRGTRRLSSRLLHKMRDAATP